MTKDLRRAPGGKARWAHTSKAERRAYMKRLAARRTELMQAGKRMIALDEAGKNS